MREMLTGLAERRLEKVVGARLAEEPVVVLNGPRTVGKSRIPDQQRGLPRPTPAQRAPRPAAGRSDHFVHREHAYTHDDWITILPLDRLWASTQCQAQK